MKQDKVYSYDKVLFEDYDSVIDQAESNFNKGDIVTLYKGDPVPYKHIDFIDSDRIIESMQEQCSDSLMQELSEDYLSHLTCYWHRDEEIYNTRNKKIDKLKKSLAETVAKWFDDNIGETNLFKVENVTEFNYTVGEVD